LEAWPKEFLAEKANVEAAIRNLDDAVSRREKTVMELAALTNQG
jgi:hypothetical protein